MRSKHTALSFLLLTQCALLCSSRSTFSLASDELSAEIVGMLPKIELHAHLHGSIRRSTLYDLTKDESFKSFNEQTIDLEHCFAIFGSVHTAVSSRLVLDRILSEVLEDYMEDNVVYLELRTTPRSLADGTTMDQYMETVVSGISRHNQRHGHSMLVKLIVSINRSNSYADAVRILELARKYRHFEEHTWDGARHKDPGEGSGVMGADPVVVGVDFSGNPNGGKFQEFQSIFEDARKGGNTSHSKEGLQGEEEGPRGRGQQHSSDMLPIADTPLHLVREQNADCADRERDGFFITVHCAETEELSNEAVSSSSSGADMSEVDETTFILEFRPDRIGHALYLQKSHLHTLVDMNMKSTALRPAPAIEICPTSNFLTLKLKSYADHPHIRFLLAIGYPLSINTDDAGIFSTTLTEEYLHVMRALRMKLEDIIEIAASAIDQTFASCRERALIAERFWRGVDDVFSAKKGDLKKHGIKIDVEQVRKELASAKAAYGNAKPDMTTFFTM